MKNVLGRVLKGVRDGESGFTLIEMLIVVGIIVALAAAIVPAVVQFSGKGEEGKKDSELTTIQSAIDSMITEESVTSVTATTNAVRNWTVDNFGVTVPAGKDLTLSPTYIRDASTTYWYCFDAKGKVTQHNLGYPEEATTPGACVE